MKHQFLLPDPGEGLLEAEIVAWRVAAGDVIEVNDVLVEIETAKSLVEPLRGHGDGAAGGRRHHGGGGQPHRRDRRRRGRRAARPGGQ